MESQVHLSIVRAGAGRFQLRPAEFLSDFDSQSGMKITKTLTVPEKAGLFPGPTPPCGLFKGDAV